jgi:protein-S-isoprenylcysteine O-methyltransferase Ste14
MFRFFINGNPFRQVTKDAAKVSLFTGLFLIGLGLLVWLLKEIIAIVFMVIFFMAGFSAIGWAIRLFIAQWKMRKDQSVYRKGVEVHFEEDNY